MEKDFGFHLAKIDFNDKSDEYVTASYYEECESKKLTMDFNSSGSGYMQILQILAPIYSVCPHQCKIVLLDEPDAHLHPNMQIALAKSLMQIQRELDVQIIISTHSPSIIQTVSPNSIIPIAANTIVSTSLTTNREVHDFISQIDNYELAKSVISGKMVFIEDANTSILEAVDRLLNTRVFYGLNTISIHKAKGKDDKLPFSLHDLLKEFLGKDIEIHFVRDRDGLDGGWCNRLIEYARSRNVILHILEKYEIENYLLSSSLIRRVLLSKHPDRQDVPTESEIKAQITAFLKNTVDLNKYNYDDSLEDNIYKTALLLHDDTYRGTNATKSEAKRIRGIYAPYTDYDELARVGMGKEALKLLLKWLNEEKLIQIGKQDIVDNLQLEDIPDELKDLLKKLKSNCNATDDFDQLEEAAIEEAILTPEEEELYTQLTFNL